ncbi:MAG: undecaprenyldiphospho-muramoylpentapeptide beta-N-acetylglucosaminyltransferase [Clostridia bacterium]|nr:undecaprenyldiphospho-muramoylpentapeptide beta-N-acetylglucosaminyltransferase [Clostridia bacterium]
MKVILCGGGTSGHVNPALNIAAALKKRVPDAEFLFIGTEHGIESTLVPKAGYPIKFVEVSGFSRKLSFANLKKNARAAVQAVTSVRAAKKIIKEFAPDLVIGTGGYVSWPTVKAAAKRGVPTLIHEQNAFPGVTTKMLAPYVDKICISFDGSEKYFPESVRENKLVLTGNPIIVDDLTRAQAREQLGLTPDEPYILSYGGSMGARRVNELVFELMEKYTGPQSIRHTHAIGRVGYTEFDAIAREKGFYDRKNLEISEYIYDMALRQAAADVIICRAGAMTLSELAVRGCAAILIPSPHVTEDHQYKNARLLADAGAALVYRETELDGDTLVSAVKDLVANPNKRLRMQTAIKSFAMRDSADVIAGCALGLTNAEK